MSDTENAARVITSVPDLDPAWGLDEGVVEQEMSAQYGTLYFGRDRLYSYNHDGVHVTDGNSCGQQAIATMLDFWDAGSFGFQRTVRHSVPPGSQSRADDGRLHYPPEYVAAVYDRYPPMSVVPFLPPSMHFTMSHQIEDAFRRQGLAVEACHSQAWGDGKSELAALKKMVGVHRIPAVVLVDLARMSNPGGSGLHWATIFGYTDRHIWMASWSETYEIEWEDFMAGWACQGIPWPHNFHAIFPYRAR